MAEMITLQLTDDMLRRAKEAAERSNRPVEAVLTDWIERGSSIEDISPLQTNVEYTIFTPLGNEAAAQTLFEVLKAAEAKDNLTS